MLILVRLVVLCLYYPISSIYNVIIVKEVVYFRRVTSVIFNIISLSFVSILRFLFSVLFVDLLLALYVAFAVFGLLLYLLYL